MRNFDIIVVGGGHAGCEAALAAARIGMKTLMLAISLDSIAMMPCNPNIGGSSKGHLVREVDALGGEMGVNIDKTYIQSRMLNTSKGPAVYSLRAQADKKRYHAEMKKVLENTNNLLIRQSEIVDIIIQDNKALGVVTESDEHITAGAVVLCMGTYLDARCLYGEVINYCGPNGMRSSSRLTARLKEHGIRMLRFKTGTPARIDGKTIDYSKMAEQKGDTQVVPFSFTNTPETIMREQISCYLTYTNSQTHDIIRRSINRSPMYAGVIEGTGTRYCPSIEDKIVRFSDKDKHQVFIEPEGEDTCEVYVSGMSTSLPEDVQLEMYRSVPGLEKAEIMRPGYAIEYDCIDATQLKLSLEFKNISGLFSAGQLNGSSGYEEAAAQGIMSGINAAMLVKGSEPVVIDRSQGYIGVLIDDLVTKGTKEPYRMMTSRAEYRLLLRQDNADLRLTDIGHKVGLISSQRYEEFSIKREAIDKEVKRVDETTIAPSALVNTLLEQNGSTAITTGAKLGDLIRRPELNYFILKEVDANRPLLSFSVAEEVGIQVKYEGYIVRQMRQVDQFKRLESKALPQDMDYDSVPGLSAEARQKLAKMRPESVGQAARITGVSPADIAVLYAYMTRQRNLRACLVSHL